ncbi:MAG: glycosyltransferase [Candidatus Riflebacteria bacterium]|nr:glycosyltransferase [Candidatus Riflebacteria bacterium]
MRIIQSLEGGSWSGGQQQAFFLAREMARAGHEVLLVCQAGSVLAHRAAEAGLALRTAPFRRELDPATLRVLLGAFRDFRPEVVNVHRAWAHTMWGLVALLQRFRGLIVTRRVLFRPDFNPISLVKYRTRAVRGYIAVSGAVAGRLRSLGIPDRRLCVVHPATDTDRFDPAAAHPRHGPLPVPPGAPLALMVANFHPNKGHLVLLEAFRQAATQWPDLHLALAGTGTDSPRLRGLAAATGAADRVHLLGFREDVPALLAASTFSLNASYEEGLPGTVRESAAMGVPVLAADNDSNRELGRFLPLAFFRTGSADDLARGLLSFRTRSITPTERAALREAAVRSFSVPAMVAATLEAYRTLGPQPA